MNRTILKKKKIHIPRNIEVTLKLFGGVLKKGGKGETPFVSKQGCVIEPGALWAKTYIEEAFRRGYFKGLNKTFHKSWKIIMRSSRFELFIEQARHYISTYGTNFQGEVYIPKESLEVPELVVPFKVVKAYTRKELIEKCLDILETGIALKRETIVEIVYLLIDTLSYKFTGKEEIKNREARMIILDMTGVLPEAPEDFLRYVIFKSTGDTLLIKSAEVIWKIKKSAYNPVMDFHRFGLERMARIFNRFKPLFLAYKTKCPGTINKISKLSKKYHKPLAENPLNVITSKLLTDKEIHWLNNATPFALFRALAMCHRRLQGQNAFVYRIRNGKSFVKQMPEEKLQKANEIIRANYAFLMEYCKNRFDLTGKTFFLPRNVELAIPTSEKMFVGNVPTGTKFYGESLAAGVYWKNSWGAHDLDVSAINIAGKVGWNSYYKQDGSALMYSGDITHAPRGAVEYMYANKKLKNPSLVLNNVFYGSSKCEYDIIIGKGDKIDRKYMMNPNNLLFRAHCKSVQRKTILGILIPEENGVSFTVLNFGAGEIRVSSVRNNLIGIQALYQKWANPLTLRKLLIELGGTIINNEEEADYNLSMEYLGIDSIMEIFY